MPETSNNTVQVLTAGGAGASAKQQGTSDASAGKQNSKRRNRGRRNRGTGGKAAASSAAAAASGNKSSEDEIMEDERNQHPIATKKSPAKEQDQNNPPPEGAAPPPAEQHLEIEGTESGDEGVVDVVLTDPEDNIAKMMVSHTPYADNPNNNNNSKTAVRLPPLPKPDPSGQRHQIFWLFVCFFGIMASFVCYGLLLEYTTSGGRKLHELSFLFVTSGLYTLTAAAGRYVRDETPTTIPPARFAILGLTSMGSTFCSVRSLRCVLTCSTVLRILFMRARPALV